MDTISIPSPPHSQQCNSPFTFTVTMNKLTEKFSSNHLSVKTNPNLHMEDMAVNGLTDIKNEIKCS